MAGPTVSEIYCWQEPIGLLKIYLASTKKGALRIGLRLEDRMDCIDFFKNLFPKARLSKEYQANRRLIEAAEAAMLNKEPKKIVKVAFSSTQFQWKVLKTISKIPFAETRTYGEVASLMGMPKAARAVGQALGWNPLPIVFP